ncbi:MAG: glycosyltransferase [Lachnospiraceae bacterium]|nr:glycosyltransferase [Lachnospiraceae bacterium]
MKASIMQCLYKRNLTMLRRQKCFAKTETVANELMELGVRDVEIAPVGLDLSVIPQITEEKMKLRARLKLPEDKIILLFVGRIDEYKNPLEAVELMARLPMHYYMVMIGTGELDQKLDQKISTLQCANRILRILRVPNEEIHSFYAASDWLVNFNRDEIFGMSILEALYQNCKVLAYHAPGPDYILREVGTVVDSMDDMKAHIMSNNFVREDTSHYVKEHFDWIHTAKIINEWIEE